MKKNKRYLHPTIKYFLITFGLAIFSLILLPVFFLATQGEENSQYEPPIHPEGIQVPKTILVYRTALNTTQEIPFDDYVKGVVAGEMPSSFEDEALKAQAVTARTYSLSKVLRGNPDTHPAAPLCDSTHCQVYRSPDELRQIKSEAWMNTGWPKIEKAVSDTQGLLMYYQGQLVEQALFHSSSGGKTENSEDVFVSFVPYLRSVDSPYEQEATHRSEETTISIAAFKEALNKFYPGEKTGTVNKTNLRILSRSEGGRVEQIQVGNATFSGRNIRDALGLSSANFSLSFDGNTLIITSDGYGHGVGMSQYGANGMAKEGFDFRQILSYYYSGVEIY